MVYLYAPLLAALGVYSYFLIDPNITFFQHSLWVWFRDSVVYWGYYRREVSWFIYLLLVLFLFVLHYFACKKYKVFSLKTYLIIVILTLGLSYPFLSHDFFNYLFDARILTFYGKNPYLFRALDFPADQWTRFMHWTHRTYPYGPTFLVLTLIPSFIGAGKFALTFVLFKGMWFAFYGLAVYLLRKIDRQSAVFFATHPLILIEGLVNGHNDFIALSLGIIAAWLLVRKRRMLGKVLTVISAGIKYMTFPYIFLGNPQQKHAEKWIWIVGGLQALVLIGVAFKMEFHPWYAMALFIVLPYGIALLKHLWIVFLGMLLSYYPFIRFGDWRGGGGNEKFVILTFFATLNILYFFGRFAYRKFLKR